MRKTLLRSLPIVARALGDQLGIDVEIGGNQAYTKGKKIVLPALPEDDGASETLARGYIDHEAGHVRFTDMTVAGATPIEHGLTNAIEDIRIEGQMEARYPGCRRNLSRLVQYLVQDGSISPPPADSHPANILLRHVWVDGALRFRNRPGIEPVAEATAKVFEQTFPEGAVVRIRALIGKIPSLESTAESLALAKRILKSLDEPDESKEPEQSSESEGDSKDSGESPSGEEGISEPDEPEQSSEPGDGSKDSGESPSGEEGTPNPKEPEQSSEPEGDSKDSGESPSGEKGTPSPGQSEDTSKQKDDSVKAKAAKQVADAAKVDLAKGIGEVAADELEQATKEKEQSTGTSGVTIAGCSGAPMSVSGIPDMTKIRQASAGIRAKLAGLVQATRLERRRLGRVGRLDTHHLTRVLTGDPRIFRGRERVVKHDTAVSILFDRSSSMKINDRITLAMESALAVTIGLTGIPKIEVEVLAFPGMCSTEVYPLKAFGAKTDPAKFVVNASGGTPMPEALWLAASHLVHRSEIRKLCFVVTDGEPNDRPGTKKIIEKMEREGIECIGVGISNPTVYSLFSSAVCIDRIQDLTPTLFALLRKRLVNKTAA